MSGLLYRRTIWPGGLNFIWSLAYRTFEAVGELTTLTGTAGLLRPNLLYKNSLMM